jgi:hypothetical protein
MPRRHLSAPSVPAMTPLASECVSLMSDDARRRTIASRRVRNLLLDRARARCTSVVTSSASARRGAAVSWNANAATTIK